MGTTCPARPLREKFSSRWHCLQGLPGGGGRRQPAGLGTGQVPAAGGGALRARERMCRSRSPSPNLPNVRVLAGVPHPGRFRARGCPTPGPQLEGPSPREASSSPPALPAPQEPPCGRRADSSPTSPSWRRAARAFTSRREGVQGPRPQPPGAPGRTTARSQPLRPVPPRRPRGGGAATPPSPAPPRRDSPGSPPQARAEDCARGQRTRPLV